MYQLFNGINYIIHYYEEKKLKYKTIHKFRFVTLIFWDINNLVNIIQRLPKYLLLVLAMVIEGTVSQIFYLGPSSRFMCFQNLCSQFC